MNKNKKLDIDNAYVGKVFRVTHSKPFGLFDKVISWSKEDFTERLYYKNSTNKYTDVKSGVIIYPSHESLNVGDLFVMEDFSTTRFLDFIKRYGLYTNKKNIAIGDMIDLYDLACEKRDSFENVDLIYRGADNIHEFIALIYRQGLKITYYTTFKENEIYTCMEIEGENAISKLIELEKTKYKDLIWFSDKDGKSILYKNKVKTKIKD